MPPKTCTVTFTKQHSVPRFAILRLVLSLLLAGTPVVTQEDSVDALVSRGDRERLQGRYGSALATYALARDKAEVSGDRPGAAGAWNGLGVTYATQSNFAGALDALSRALAIREELGLWPDAATSLTNIGGVYRQLGRFPDAIAHHRRALALLDGAGNERRRANTLNNLGVVHVAQGDYDEALTFYAQALALHETTSNVAGVAGTLSNIGLVHRRRGNNAEALRIYERSLALNRSVGDRRMVVDSLMRIGVLHSAQGHTTLAMALYREALAGFNQLGIRIEVARLQTNIGNLHARLGELDAAEMATKEGLRVREEIGDTVGIADSTQSLAGLARRRGDLARAERLYAEAHHRFETLGDRRGIAQALMGLQQVLGQASEHTRALATSLEATDVNRAIGDRDQLWQTLTATGRTHVALGDRRAARAAFAEAVAIIESLRLDIAGGEADQQRSFERKLAPYHELLSLAVDEGASDDAFRLAEQAKARVVLDVLRGGRVNVTPAMTDDEQTDERGIHRRLESLNAQVLAERRQARPDLARIAALDEEVVRARGAREDFETRLYAAHPDLRVQRSEAAPATVEQAAGVLPGAGSAALEYVVTDREVLVFVLTRPVSKAAGAADLTVQRLAISPADLTRLAGQLSRELANRDLQFKNTAARLYDALVRPVAAQLAGRSAVIVVPDGILWQVPFQALWNSRTSKYVIETHAVAYAPSLTVLSESIRRRPADGTDSNAIPQTARAATLLAFGNPAFGTTRVGETRDASRTALPAAEREVNALGRLYGPTRSRIRTGSEAREDVLKAEAGEYSILHVATHGILDDANPMYSHVLLAPSSGGSGDDGELQAWEIARLQLGARLVVLSGCETARGRVAPGEGVIGLTWSLFVAGASTAVVSQWAVDSATTTDLMLAFHRHVSGAGGRAARLSPARALQQAAIPLLRSSRSRHPFYWAAFVVVGDGF